MLLRIFKPPAVRLHQRFEPIPFCIQIDFRHKNINVIGIKSCDEPPLQSERTEQQRRDMQLLIQQSCDMQKRCIFH